MQVTLLTVRLCEHWQPKRSLHCLYGFPLEYEHCLTFQSTKGGGVEEFVEGDNVEEFVEDTILINPIIENKPKYINFIAYAFSQKKS